MTTSIQKIVSSYRKQRNLSLREFARELSEGLNKEEQVTYETIRNWERGEYKPNFPLLMTLVMKTRDWRMDFGFDILSAMRPEFYEPMTQIGWDAKKSIEQEQEKEKR
jgi:transcriptional regulator with XRE-family HTH domain